MSYSLIAMYHLVQMPESLPAFVVSAPEDSHCSAVTAVACCGDYVCSGGGDAAIRVYKATTLEPVKCALPFPTRPTVF